jgi:hypothetical protein
LRDLHRHFIPSEPRLLWNLNTPIGRIFYLWELALPPRYLCSSRCDFSNPDRRLMSAARWLLVKHQVG